VDPLFIILAVVAVAMLVLAVTAAVLRRRSRPEETPTEAPPPAIPPAPAAVGLRSRLAKTRASLGDRLAALFGRGTLDGEFWDGLEETLIAADVGVVAAAAVVERVRNSDPGDVPAAKTALRDELEALFAGRDRGLRTGGSPAVVLVVGVNGTGKTTSIAKLAARLERGGETVLLGAADTYRAAADQQLRTWAERVGVEIVGGQEGADPAAVAFDAFQAARARGKDVLIVDTAGRLHSKSNLMDELGKVARIVRREAGELDEVLLILDGTAGQNGIAQARSFTAAVGVTGIVITKLDGTARGGVAVAIEHDLGIPVKFIGVGEGVDDLIPFEPHDFVDALLGD
jgi:fused signal recognition particle receptor